MFLYKEQPKKQELQFVGFYLVALLCFVGGFYFITGTNQTNTFLSNHLSFHSLKTPIHIIIKSILDIVSLFYIYFIIATFYLFKTRSTKKYAPLLVLIIGTITSSLLAWVLFYPIMDSAQLFVIPAISITHLGILLLFISFLWHFRDNIKYQIPLALLIIVGITESFITTQKNIQSYHSQKYSASYITGIKAFAETNNKNPIGVYIKGKDDYQLLFDKNPAFGALGDYLKIIKSNYNTISLSVFDIPLDSLNQIDFNREQVFITSSACWKFVNAQKESGSFKSISQSQIDFIRTYHIQYGIISKNGIISPEMNIIASKTITDSISGERFVIFTAN